jgi:hypothetical protein
MEKTEVKRRFLIAWVISLAVAAGCGASDAELGEWDDTCYDCRTVCEGVKTDAMDGCLAKCVECQGYSECFARMEGRYRGMLLLMRDWTRVNCEDLNGGR